MKKISLLIFLCILSFTANSQTFNSTSGPVPDNSCTAANDFPINVSGVGLLGTNSSFDQIEINILMSSDSDLNISLVAPNGILVPLAWGQGGDDAENFTQTVFRADATMTLSEGSAPFTGIFYPDGDFYAFDGIQADGVWKLRICDSGIGSIGTLQSASLKFVPYVPPACATPTFVHSDKITSASAHFFWDPVNPNANYYYVFNNSAANPTVAGTKISGTEFTVNGLNPETDYYFHVRNDCGFSSLSAWRKAPFKTAPANDNCTNATKITSLPFNKTQDILGANYIDGFIMNCGDGMNDGAWYSFYIANAGTLQIDLTAVSGWNPEIAIFKGTCGTLTCVSSADSAGIRGDETLSLAVTPGLYYVSVGDGSGTIDNQEGLYTIGITGTASLGLLGTDSFDKTNFTYYPNPVKNKLNLSYFRNISNVVIYNLLGQEVMTKAINASTSEIDMSGLSTGTYVVKIMADEQVQSFKVMKE